LFPGVSSNTRHSLCRIEPQPDERSEVNQAVRLLNERLRSVFLVGVADDFPSVPAGVDDFEVGIFRREFFSKLGASVMQVAPGEVYTALDRGVVDGYGWPLLGIFEKKEKERKR